MATNMIRSNMNRLLLLRCNLRSLSTNVRVNSNFSGGSAFIYHDNKKKKTEAEENALFGSLDSRLVLPGNVGIIPSSNKQEEKVAQSKRSLKRQILETRASDILTYPLVEERIFRKLTDLVREENKMEDREAGKFLDILEVNAQICPNILRLDLQILFSKADIINTPLSVITFSQKTQNDMSCWSQEMESERDKLTEHFIDAAKYCCKYFKELGYWADFVDPSSGMAYNAPYSSITLFETDERYRHLGFVIEDLGCCKVVRHQKFGTSVFVGSLVTDAPVRSSAMKDLLDEWSLQQQE